jgi:exodeoxyribonuclease V alpha subunit
MFTLDKIQIKAVDAACCSAFSIITGGAGVGKTTIIKEITTRLEAKSEKVLLCAFAGKAAARLREACEHPASTIHRMLKFNGSEFALESLSGSTVIVDEASMVDSLLMAEVMCRTPARLVLVGDPAQLPPVGRGQPFHDIINLRPDLVSTLTTCYRATEAVYQAANVIRSGGRPPMQAESENEKWSITNTGNAERTQDAILRWVKAGAFDFEQDIILVARNGENDAEPCTVRGLNKAIVDAISPRDEKTKFVKGDRVINTKNLIELDVWNGTTGTVHEVDIDGGVWVHTDTPVIDVAKSEGSSETVYTDYVLFSKENRKHLSLAYALTVHKAQGSQARNVCMVALQRDTHCLLDRSLLYTGVTRTKQACVVVGEVAAVYAAIDKVGHKRTVLQQLDELAEKEAKEDVQR